MCCCRSSSGRRRLGVFHQRGCRVIRLSELDRRSSARLRVRGRQSCFRPTGTFDGKLGLRSWRSAQNRWLVRRHRVEIGGDAPSGHIQRAPSPYPSSISHRSCRSVAGTRRRRHRWGSWCRQSRARRYSIIAVVEWYAGMLTGMSLRG